MLHIQILGVGEIREPFYRAGLEEYLKRLRPYSRVAYRTVKDEPLPSNPSDTEVERVKAAEGEKLLGAMEKGAFLVALDPRGKEFSSEELASFLEERATAGDSRLSFCMGGTLGLSQALLDQARLKLSLSRFTFPHQMVPLLIAEQLYRAFRIARGEPYHY